MKNNLVTKITLATLAFCATLIFASPSINDSLCQSRIFTDLEEKTESIKSANISITKEIREEGENSEQTSYGSDGSGVIIAKSGSTYYALTAAHVVREQNENTSYIIRTVYDTGYSISDDQSDPAQTQDGMSQQSEDGQETGSLPQHVSLEEYYESFPRAEVIMIDKEGDFALLSFKLTQNLQAAPISQDKVKLHDRVVMATRNDASQIRYTYGFVLSKEPVPFRTKHSDINTTAYKHNAYGTYGSSGSGVYNENMKLIGIDVGGSTGPSGKFVCEYMLPIETIYPLITNSVE